MSCKTEKNRMWACCALNCIKFHLKIFKAIQIVVHSSKHIHTYFLIVELRKCKRFRTVIIIIKCHSCSYLMAPMAQNHDSLLKSAFFACINVYETVA